MSIFSMFKKIFSSGSDDSFGEKKSLEEYTVDTALDNRAKDQFISEQEQAKQIKNINWPNVIQKVFASSEMQSLISKLREAYSKIDYTDISLFFDEVSDGIDLVIELMCKNESKDFVEITKMPLFKSQIAEALLKVVSNSNTKQRTEKYDYDAETFNRAFNPEMNNLASLCRFISDFLRSYRMNPKVALNIILPYFESKDYALNFIKECYEIEIFIQNFRQISYNDISRKYKQQFLDRINSFVSGYSKNNILTALNILIKTEKAYERSNPKTDYSVIGGSL